MGKYYINGGKKLSGKVKVSGAKNAALPMLAAAVATRGENCFDMCPQISDVDSMAKILRSLGCVAKRKDDKMMVDATNLSRCSIPEELMKEMRSSVFLAGSLLARCGEAVISNPGGCHIGKRPIDIHIKSLTQMGAEVCQTDNSIHIKAAKLTGADLKLDYPSVGATENIMLAAVAAKGDTIIRNAAREPEIIALADYINKCGGNVQGAGTSVIKIEGETKLSGSETAIMPDRIEAGTYLLMGMGTEGNVFLEGISEELFRPLTKILRDAGCRIYEKDGGIYAFSDAKGTVRCRIDTAPYPGFPTDLQPQITAFLTTCGKGSIITENIFERRFNYTKQLIKMGADIEISQKQVIIKNNNMLYGEEVSAEDLRGGAALVIAGLMAEGCTTVCNTKYIKRGYSGFVDKIRQLGGDILEDER